MEQDKKVFGRVEDGKIVEYPVYEEHILVRGHPFEWYTPCIFEGKPTDIPQYYFAREAQRIVGDQIVVSYVVEPMGISQLINTLWGGDPNRPLMPNETELVSPALADIDPLLLKAIETAAKDLIQAKLDTFAATRGYDGILSAASYVSSTNTGYAADGQRAVNRRDATWDAANTFFNNVLSGQAPMIKSFTDVEAVLPELTWS